MNVKQWIKKLLRAMGYNISQYSATSHPLARRKALIEAYNVDLILDIGANTGQFAEEMRGEIGYSGNIISFEPQSREFKILKGKTDNDNKWKAINCAIGDTEEQLKINIAGNSYSSSLLDMLESHEKSAPESKYTGVEVVDVKTLDNIISELAIKEDNIYLKIDTQGFESRVIKGAARSLSCIDTIQLEMSLVPLYKDELLFNDMSSLLYSKGYVLVALEPGFSDKKSGQMLQVDGIFHRPKST